MNFIADWLLNILNFEQLEIHVQKKHNKKASLETIKEKTIKENKEKIKKISNESLNQVNNQVNNNNSSIVTIEYNDGSLVNGKKMW